jgi:hypothetical protein
MTFEDFKGECFSLMKEPFFDEFHLCLQLHHEHLGVLMSGGQGDYRFIDYLQEYTLVQIKDNDVAAKLLKTIFDYGSDPNRSCYTQSKVGFLTEAAERSLELVRLFVERGAHVNHDLFGKPACWPMISAVCSGKLDIAQYLVEHGAVVNFVNIHGLSPLDYAKPGTPMYDYLLSLGAKSGSELPKDHLPQPEPAEEEQPSISNHVEYYFGRSTYFDLPDRDSDEPLVCLWSVPRWAGNEQHVGLVTDGLSHRDMPVPDGVTDGVKRAELAFVLPASWPLPEDGLVEEPYSWPIDWLRQLACYPFDSGDYFRRANIIANGEPPERLGVGVPMTSLLVRTADDPKWGTWTRPDGLAVELMMVTPLFTSERDAERRLGLPAFLKLVDADPERHVTRLGRKPFA